MSGERWDEITQWVDAEGRVALADLASRFEVSEMTIRRDLDALTAAGRLRRVRGGAVSLTTAPSTPATRSRTEPPAAAPPVPSVEAPSQVPSPAPPLVPAESPVDREPLPSPGFDPARAPSSLGSVIASWAGAFPAGFPATPAERPVEPQPRVDVREEAREEAPPGWDVPLNPSGPTRTPPSAHPSASVPPPPPRQPVALTHPADDPWLRAAHVALADLAPGCAVLLTGGTGALALAHHVARLAARSPATPVTVAVTALAPATVLTGAPGVRLVVLGGEAEPGGADLVGPAALAALEDLHLDVVVLTPTGLDARGAWAPTSAAAALLSAAVARAERAVAVVAPTALGRPGLVRTAPLAALAQVVAVPAAGEAGQALAARLEAVRSAAPSAPVITAA